MAKKKNTLKEKKGKMKAIPTEVEGIKFKSKLEAYCYTKLKENKIKALYESERFTVLEGFVYNDKKIQPITYTPDFVGKDFIIECKGHPNDAFPLRWKLFLSYLVKNKSNKIAYLPHSVKEVDATIESILKRRDEIKEERKKVRSKRNKQLLSFLV